MAGVINQTNILFDKNGQVLELLKLLFELDNFRGQLVGPMDGLFNNLLDDPENAKMTFLLA